MTPKLSIIIPAYNAEPYIEALINRLKPQMNEEVEVQVIDDGSSIPYLQPYPWVKVFRQDNKGISSARNKGLDLTTGEYVHFIDADDLVPENYIEYILNIINTEHPDYIELSWKSLPGPKSKNFDYHLRSKSDRLDNPSASTRIYKRSFIGDHRFNENKDASEDHDFNQKLDFEGKKRSITTEYMYFYRDYTPSSNSKRFSRGTTRTKVVAYYYKKVTEDMQWLLEQIKEDDKLHEVWLLTNQCEIKELERYANVIKPRRIFASIIKGEPNDYIMKKNDVLETQVVIYTHDTYEIGGIETFIYNFCKLMNKKYDILVVYDIASPVQLLRLTSMVPVLQNRSDINIKCDTLIINRVRDEIPENIMYKQSVQMVHGCKAINNRPLPDRQTYTVCVSNTVKDSYGAEAEKAEVIHNVLADSDPGNMLLLVSATRLDTDEKGQNRMRKLAELMDKQGINYIWLYYSNVPLPNASKNMIHRQPTVDIVSVMKKASYLVQLSDTEAFCYSIVEALSVGTPVIATDLPVLEELGIKDKVNAHIIPFDIDDSFDTRVFLNEPSFDYKYNNAPELKKWRKILGNTKPKGNYNPENNVRVRCLKKYTDILLQRDVMPGEIVEMSIIRAYKVQDSGYGVITD